MGIWHNKALPRVIDLLLTRKPFLRLRAEVCAPLVGHVVEVGFGSGRNLPYLPPSVTKLSAVEPSQEARRLAAPLVARSPIPVEFVGLDGARLPLPDHSVDSALVTWTLCTIPDVEDALRELARVLRPGGVLRFVEHGRAAAPSTARWQDRLDPLWSPLAGGCHLNRDPVALLRGAGFVVDHKRFVMTPAVTSTMYLGSARAEGVAPVAGPPPLGA